MILNFPEQQRKKTPPDDAPTNRPIDHTIVPRGLACGMAASYIGVSPSLFSQMVADGRMPKPKAINSRVVWDKWEIDAAFTALPHKDATATDDDEWGVAV
jgi:predicted DNA-binding transcriptional regulator AlpA